VDITTHPIWSQKAPTTKQKISKFKKPFHLARIYLAKQYAKLFPGSTFIGVTGSVGKTTTVKALEMVLSKKFNVLTTKANLDPILNIPETILKAKRSTNKIVLEMGIEYLGEMDFYLSLVKPQTCIITTIAYQHSEFLGDLESIASEKGKLIESLPGGGKAFLNFDDVNVRKLAETTKAEVIFYGTDEKNCQVWASNVKIENFITSFEINYGVERVEINYPLLGEHQIYPALAAASVGISEGVSLIQVKKALEQMTPEEHRMEIFQGYNNSIIIDDSYNGSPVSIEAALNTLEQIPAKRRILVLGETKELGKYSEKLHRQIAQKIYSERIDFVYLGTGDTKYVAEELLSLGFLPEKMEANLQNPQVVSKLLKVLSKGDVCLVKGSRSLRLDEVVTRIVKKQ